MLSEVDIRDWENKIKDAREAAVNDEHWVVLNFINSVEKLIKKQTKQIPALFKEGYGLG